MEFFNVYRVSVLQDEKCSGDWLYNNANVHCLTVHLKTVKMLNFMLCVFYQFRGKKTPLKINYPWKTKGQEENI